LVEVQRREKRKLHAEMFEMPGAKMLVVVVVVVVVVGERHVNLSTISQETRE